MDQSSASTIPALRASRPSARGSLSVVVPLFDEEAGVPALIESLFQLVENEGPRRAVEIVLVDDGSTDRTWGAIAEASPAGDDRWRRIRHERNRGLTAALRTGTEAARHDLVGWLDADLTYDPVILSRLAAALDDGADLAVASCHHPGGRMTGVPTVRRWLSRGASFLYRLSSGHRIHTFTCMVRVQPRTLALRTWPARDGFLGVTEQLLRALDGGAQVSEVPAELRARRAGRSKMRVIRATRPHLGLMLAARRGLRSADPSD